MVNPAEEGESSLDAAVLSNARLRSAIPSAGPEQIAKNLLWHRSLSIGLGRKFYSFFFVRLLYVQLRIPPSSEVCL